MTAVSVRAGRMSLRRLEWLRLTRTPRAIALGVVFLFIGLIEPVGTKYESKLIGHLGNGARIYLPPPTPADGLASYINEVAVIGLVMVVAFAAGALSFDTRQGLATFLRTRVTSMWQLVLPRCAVNAAAATVAYVLGTFGAWYETQVLIGPLPAGEVFAGMLCGVVYLGFAVAVTALAVSLVRSTIGAAALALGFLLLLPIAGLFHAIASWLPSALVNAPVNLVNGSQHLSHFVPSLAVAVVIGAAALDLAVRRLQTREI
jgi:ABC-2 type transport system permease protein